MQFRVFLLTLCGKEMSWLKFEVLVAMAVYACLVVFFVLGRKQAKKQSRVAKKTHDLNDLTLVVPFRNEQKKLQHLVASIAKLDEGPKEIIFVNDHSEDALESVPFIGHISNRLLHLPKNQHGKKAAIRLGVSAATTSFILTWDADVSPDTAYFSELKRWTWTDLTLLPVEMRGSKFISGFFAMDYQLQTQANLALSAFFRPITASGANLLFAKTEYEKSEQNRADEAVASGDDLFLLKSMRERKKTISVLTADKLCLETQAPKTLTNGMSQRLRWLGKSGQVKDSFATSIGILVFIAQMLYYTFAFSQLATGDWGATVVMILIKGELDAFLCTYKFQEQFSTVNVFLYQLSYPIYILALLFGLVFVKPTWKGRELVNRQ